MSSLFSLSLLEAGRCESRGGQVRPASSEEEEPLLLQGRCWLGKRTQCCLDTSFVRVLIHFLKGVTISWFHHIRHWVSAPEFWRRHIQTRASDFIDALNYSSWVATDGINAESQIRFYRETIQGTSVLCTPLCILKSLFLVDWAVSFVSSPASGGIDSIINVLLSHGY